jgi:uncharacterized protein (TIGR00369 family)
MTEEQGIAVPEGFELIPQGLGFMDRVGPCYRWVEGERVRFGIPLMPHHANSMGICHGGVLMTLADIAAASGVNAARGMLVGAPTINISLDFIGSARIGEWIETESQNVTIKRHFGFCSGIIHCERGLIARYNGTFYFPDHQGVQKGDAFGGGVLAGLQDALAKPQD